MIKKELTIGEIISKNNKFAQKFQHTKLNILCNVTTI